MLPFFKINAKSMLANAVKTGLEWRTTFWKDSRSKNLPISEFLWVQNKW